MAGVLAALAALFCLLAVSRGQSIPASVVAALGDDGDGLPPLPPHIGRVQAPELGEGATCELEIRPPQPKHGCYWEVLRDPASACLTGYRRVCMLAIPDDCGPLPLERPAFLPGCAWISLHDDRGCIRSFVCEPNDCPLVENDSIPGSACNWLPVRDQRGCIQSYKCEPVGEGVGHVSAVEADSPILSAAPLKQDHPRLPVRSAALQVIIPPLPVQIKRRPIAIPPQLPLPAPVPALPTNVQIRRASVRRASIPLAARAHFPTRPLCPAPPFKPANTDKCNWAPVFAPLGCIVDWRCVNVPPAAPEPCPKAPRRPKSAKNCLWVTVTDSRGCILKYECEPVKKPKCPPKPDRPANSPECAYLAIRNTNKCIISYECIPKRPPLPPPPFLLPPAFLGPRPRLSLPLPPQPILPLLRQRLPLLRRSLPLLPNVVPLRRAVPLPRANPLPPRPNLLPPRPNLLFSPGVGPLGPINRVASRRPVSVSAANRPQRPIQIAEAGPIPKVTIPVATSFQQRLPPPAAPIIPPPVASNRPVPKLNVPIPYPQPELVPSGRPLPPKFSLGGFPGFQDYNNFQQHYQKYYAQQASRLSAQLGHGPQLRFTQPQQPQVGPQPPPPAQPPPTARLPQAPTLPQAAALPPIAGSPAAPGTNQPDYVDNQPPVPSTLPNQPPVPATLPSTASESFVGVHNFGGFPNSPAPQLTANPFQFTDNLFPFKISQTATDRHDLCCWWAQIGECDSNLFYMRSSCQRSCGTPGCTGK